MIKSFFRHELSEILKNQLGYLVSSASDGAVALEETEGQLAEFLNEQLRRAYVAGHSEGVQAVMEDNKLDTVFSPETDKIYAERKYEVWKSSL